MQRTRSRVLIFGALVLVLAGVMTLNVLETQAEARKSQIKITPGKQMDIPQVRRPHQGSTPGFYPKVLVDISFVGESDWAAKLLTDLRELAAKDPKKLKVAWTVPGNPAPPDPPGAMFVINDGRELGIVVPRTEDLAKVPEGYPGYLTDAFLQHVRDLTEMNPLPWAGQPAPMRVRQPELAGQPK